MALHWYNMGAVVEAAVTGTAAPVRIARVLAEEKAEEAELEVACHTRVSSRPPARIAARERVRGLSE
jgi:hypothetical protein